MNSMLDPQSETTPLATVTTEEVQDFYGCDDAADDAADDAHSFAHDEPADDSHMYPDDGDYDSSSDF